MQVAATLPVSDMERAKAWYAKVFELEPAETTEETIARAETMLRERGVVTKGDTLVITLAVPSDVDTPTNTLKLHRVR